MKKVFATMALLALLVGTAACGAAGGAKEIKSGAVGNLTVTLANDEGVLRHGVQEFVVTFRDAASGKGVDVGSASLNFHMPAMGTMAAMNNAATLTTTSTPGVYRATISLQMGGEWQAQFAYEGAAGAGKGSFPVTAQ